MVVGSSSHARDEPLLTCTPIDEDMYLRDLCAVDSLEAATSLSVQINTTTTTVGHWGDKLPALQELNLTGSAVESIRDIGTGFRVLRVLWVARCGLCDLDGLSLPCLRELYAAYNDISELHALDACGNLELLDVEGNCIEEPSALAMLPSACPRLQSLSMGGNPMVMRDGFGHQLEQLRANLAELHDIDVGQQLCTDDDAADDAHAPMHAVDNMHEAAFVRAGIKSARVGVDSVEFRHAETSLLMAAEMRAPDASTHGIQPSSPSGWLRCSQHWTPSSTDGGEHLRAETAAPQSPGSLSQRGLPPGSPVGGSLATAARPSTASLLSNRTRASAPPTAAVAGGLYWRKHRIRSTLDAAHTNSRGAGARGDGSDDDDDPSGGHAASSGASALTHGDAQAGTGMGGSAVRNLRRRKQQAADRAGASGASSRGLAPDSPDARVGRASSRDLPGRAHASVCDESVLLEELRQWKLDTADRALLPDDEVDGPPAAAPWADGIGDSGGSGRAVSSETLDLSRASLGSPAGSGTAGVLPCADALFNGGSSGGFLPADVGAEPSSPGLLPRATSSAAQGTPERRPPLSPAVSLGRRSAMASPSVPDSALGTASELLGSPTQSTRLHSRAAGTLGPIQGPTPARTSRLTLVKVIKENSGRTIASTVPHAHMAPNDGHEPLLAASSQDARPAAAAEHADGMQCNPLFVSAVAPPQSGRGAGDKKHSDVQAFGTFHPQGIGSSPTRIPARVSEIDLANLNPQPIARPNIA